MYKQYRTNFMRKVVHASSGSILEKNDRDTYFGVVRQYLISLLYDKSLPAGLHADFTIVEEFGAKRER